jgi:hypothetical protein
MIVVKRLQTLRNRCATNASCTRARPRAEGAGPSRNGAVLTGAPRLELFDALGTEPRQA